MKIRKKGDRISLEIVVISLAPSQRKCCLCGGEYLFLTLNNGVKYCQCQKCGGINNPFIKK
jgi:hypothetical protein